MHDPTPPTMRASRIRTLAVALMLGGLCSLPAAAQSLVELYESALAYDAAFQSARSQYEATVAPVSYTHLTLPTSDLV